MSATRRLARHSCRTFVSLAEVLLRLATRNSPHRRCVGMFDRNLTARVHQRLEKSSVTHRCTECKRWISVTPQSFRPHMTAGQLTRLTKAEARALAARPVVFTVSPTCAADGAIALAKLPAYGFDVRHPQTQEVRGRDAVAWQGARKVRQKVR